MVEIKLEHGTWTYNEADQLGPAGGFGEVFQGRGPDGKVAIKRLKIDASAAAHRELKIGKNLASRELKNVVPIFDYGQDADSDRYFLVMPVCDYSLQDFLNKNPSLSWEEAKPIVLDIVSGLKEVGDIVHRDLKPGNILWNGEQWQVADFGIAKFVEESTSFETLREALTPAYAAPEQWKLETPTRATDVYALACILHSMINGHPPFEGDIECIRESHMHEQPAELEGAPPRLRSLISHMLRKTSASRPNLDRCAKVFQSIEELRPGSAVHALAAAGHDIARKEAEAEAKRRSAETLREERYAIAEEACSDFKRVFEEIYSQIEEISESAKRGMMDISLGPARLSCLQPSLYMAGNDQTSFSSEPNWDILAYSSIRIDAQITRIVAADTSTYTVSAGLVFAKLRVIKNTVGVNFRFGLRVVIAHMSPTLSPPIRKVF